MALEKNALGDMTPRKWLENIASRTSTLGSTLRVFGRMKNTIVEHGLMMRSLLEDKGSHPPPNCSCKVFLNLLSIGMAIYDHQLGDLLYMFRSSLA
jgi:hypothetical protein